VGGSRSTSPWESSGRHVLRFRVGKPLLLLLLLLLILGEEEPGEDEGGLVGRNSLQIII